MSSLVIWEVSNTIVQSLQVAGSVPVTVGIFRLDNVPDLALPSMCRNLLNIFCAVSDALIDSKIVS